MKNWSVTDNGASIVSFSSQYHHESRADRILLRAPTLCWFTSIYEHFPQWIIIDMGREVNLAKIGFFMHGENKQSPRKISFQVVRELPADHNDYNAFGTPLVNAEVERRTGDFIWDMTEPVIGRYVRYTIHDNYGGSGSMTTKLYLFGEEINE